jgi:methyl-accepting chemotaxis protein
MTQAEQHIDSFIAAIRRRWQAQQTASWALAGAAILLAWLLVMVLLDNVLMLGPGQLLLGWMAVLAAGAAITGRFGYQLIIRPPSADRLALMYEARTPGTSDRLINAVQFLASGLADLDAMACAAVIENAGHLHLATAPGAVDGRPVRRAGVASGALALLMLAYAAIWPAWTANAIGRLLHPLQPGPHLLATEPIVAPGHVQVVEGQPLTIEATVRPSPQGRPADKVTIEYRIGQFDWAGTPMVPTGENRFTHLFAGVREPLDYHVRADRSLSPTYHVRVQYRPRIEQLQAIVTRPVYAGGIVKQLKPGQGDVTALAGSTVEIQLVSSLPLASGKLAMADGTAAPLTIRPDDPRQATARFELARSTTYTIQLIDTAGLANLDPPRYALIAEPDQPPVVSIPRPGRELSLPQDATVPLTIEADDDVGLSRIVLQVRAGGGDWKDVTAWTVSDHTARHQAVQTELALTGWSLKVNDLLLYRAVAYDNRPPQPNMGVGRTWSITVVEGAGDESILTLQARQLLQALQRILALQRQNRTELDMDRQIPPIRNRQHQVRDLTMAVIDQQHKALRPMQAALDVLTSLADGPMLQATQSLAKYEGTYQQRYPLKPPILKIMDEIIARLEELIGQIEKSLAAADKAQQALEKLTPAEKEQALKSIRDLLQKLREFLPEQDKVIEGTEELVRKGEDLTDKDKQKLEQLKGTEDKWDQVFTDSVKDINKLTEQGFADRTIANDYKQMVEQIEEASKNLTPQLITLAVPREQAGRELAESLREEMEMWLPNSPDHIKWMMEEPLDQPEIPMPELPDELSDLIGDLIEQQDELNDAAEDVTSAWADSISAAGWAVSDGPISNFSAVGKTGNQLPENIELSGRSGDGRSGRSQGQLVSDVAKGLPGRKTPTRITNDAYEQGVVKELQQMATSGSTGGGKARGSGQEGLQGTSPPPLMRDMQFMRDWQQRIRQKAEKVAGQARQLRTPSEDLERGIERMKQAEQAAVDGRYADMFARQQMVLQNLKMAGDLTAREAALRVDRAQRDANKGRRILDAMDEPVPQEYEQAVRRYFLQLSESK